MRHDNNRDFSLGTYVLLGGIAVSIEAVGFSITAVATVGLLSAILLLSLVAAMYSHIRARQRTTPVPREKIMTPSVPAQIGGAKAARTL